MAAAFSREARLLATALFEKLPAPSGLIPTSRHAWTMDFRRTSSVMPSDICRSQLAGKATLPSGFPLVTFLAMMWVLNNRQD